MKLLLSVILYLLAFYANAQVAINPDGSRPHPSAMLDVKSVNKGFLPPRLSFDAIHAIPNPALGLMVFDTTFRNVKVFNGSRWVTLGQEHSNPGGAYGQFALYAEMDRGEIHPKKVAADSWGNVYTAGYFYNTVNFGNITLTSLNNAADMYVAKYDKNGVALWAKKFGGTSLDMFTALTVYANQDVFVGGEFASSSITVNNEVFYNTGGQDVLFMKLTPQGDVSWAKKTVSNGNTYLNDLAIDIAENVYTVGYCIGTYMGYYDFPYQNNSAPGSSEAYITKTSSGGVTKWCKFFQGSGDDVINGVATYGNAVYATGDFTSPTLGINNVSLTNASTSRDIFVCKLDTVSGNTLWAQRFGGGFYEIARDIAVNYLDGTMYILGHFLTGATNIGSTTLANKGDVDGMLITISPSLQVNAYAINSPSTDYMDEIVYNYPYLYLNATISNPTTLSVINRDFPLRPTAFGDEVVIRLNATNPFNTIDSWLEQHGCANHDESGGIAVGVSTNSIYTAGFATTGPVYFNGLVQTKAGYYLWRHMPQ